jgi:chitodextrinase/inosine-uridine nucleoside N-ribohydrolase
MLRRSVFLGITCFVFSMCLQTAHSADGTRVPPWTHNHLLDAEISSNIETYDKGLRGQPADLIYDFENRSFQRKSSWHEYGIGAGKSLGVVSEAEPVWWMASWKAPVACNYIGLSGCYPNQPQPETAWKIELRSDGVWREHERGIGGWYDHGRYSWRSSGDVMIQFDAFRVSIFSKDEKTPLNSIHFRGEKGISWVLASVPEIDARVHLSARRIRLGDSIDFRVEAVAGDIQSWKWDFGDGTRAVGKDVRHRYDEPGTYTATLEFADNRDSLRLESTVWVGMPIEARIAPLQRAVRAGERVAFDARSSHGDIATFVWDFGDASAANGETVHHTFRAPGVYEVSLRAESGTYAHTCTALVRVHDETSQGTPQLLLDTDQKNEQDDQYYLGYAVFSELDLLGVNSVHHGGGQEPINYEEIIHVLGLARKSGASAERMPRVFRGADERLEVPDSGRWFDTMPIVTDAAEAILAAARGASSENPAWVVPVGPGTNVASAILLARERGLDLEGRLRVMWLGGANKAITQEFNGNNDPWSLYVVGQSGIELWITPAPVGARVRIDKRTESDWYADHVLGQYLKKITPARDKPLYDPAVLSAIINLHRDQGWIHEVENVALGGPDERYRWRPADGPSNVKLIREIDQAAMKKDIFDTLKGKPTRLRD